MCDVFNDVIQSAVQNHCVFSKIAPVGLFLGFMAPPKNHFGPISKVEVAAEII
jgi:hypothetical protein